jgi:hypothetical protein
MLSAPASPAPHQSAPAHMLSAPTWPHATYTILLLLLAAAGMGQSMFLSSSPDAAYLIEDVPLNSTTLARSNRTVVQVGE